MQVLSRLPSGWPALVLNADYRPLSYYPLSLWPWQETIKAVFLGRVDVVSTYDKRIHSPSFEMPLPSVVSLKQYVAGLLKRRGKWARTVSCAGGYDIQSMMPLGIRDRT